MGSNDPFEEFEFKPITDGLGFHQKSKNLREQLEKAALVEDTIKGVPTPPSSSTGDTRMAKKPTTFEDILAALEKSPLPKKEAVQGAAAAAAASAAVFSGSGGSGSGASANSSSGLKAPPPISARSTANANAGAGAPSLSNLFIKSKTANLEMTEPVGASASMMVKGSGRSATAIPTQKAMDIERAPQPVQSPFPSSDVFRRPNMPEIHGDISSEIKKVPVHEDLVSVGTRRGAADSPRGSLVEAPVSLSAALLDFVVIVAMGLMFVVSLLLVTGVDLNVVIANLQADRTTQVALAVLFVAVMQMYMVIARSFFGRTLGEWTFDLQMGRDEEHSTGGYPLRVTWRCAIVTLTGLITLPLLSLIVRKDLAAKLTGLQLYRQNF